jgi:hypothetical protein
LTHLRQDCIRQGDGAGPNLLGDVPLPEVEAGIARVVELGSPRAGPTPLLDLPR